MVQVELPIPRLRVRRVGDHAGPGSSVFSHGVRHDVFLILRPEAAALGGGPGVGMACGADGSVVTTTGGVTFYLILHPEASVLGGGPGVGGVVLAGSRIAAVSTGDPTVDLILQPEATVLGGGPGVGRVDVLNFI